LRKFEQELGEDFTLLSRIERGQRYPPKPSLEKFAKALSLTTPQLEALIAVERRGLDPHELLPEIPPAHIPNDYIEKAAQRVLNKYCRAVKRPAVKLPVPVDDVLAEACRISADYRDFKTKKIPGASCTLYGCLIPNGFEGKDQAVFVNTGRIRGRRLSAEEDLVDLLDDRQLHTHAHAQGRAGTVHAENAGGGALRMQLSP